MFIRVTVGHRPDGNGYHFFCPAFPEIYIGTLTEEQGFDAIPEALMMAIEHRLCENEPLPIGEDFSFTLEEQETEWTFNQPSSEEKFRRLSLNGNVAVSMGSG